MAISINSAILVSKAISDTVCRQSEIMSFTEKWTTAFCKMGAEMHETKRLTLTAKPNLFTVY